MNLLKMGAETNFISKRRGLSIFQNINRILGEKKIEKNISCDKIVIEDKINRITNNNAKAFFHFHSSLTKPLINGNDVMLGSSGIFLEFERASTIYIDEYQLSAGFNKTNLAYKIVVLFDKTLKTKINL